MRFAVIKDNLVTNLIVAAAGQQAELETALGARLEDAAGFGLTMGDLWIPERGVWARNQDGEQVVLEPLTPEEKTKYQALSDELEGLKDDLSAAYTEGVNSIDAV
nr:MAG TPA: hypothetical protein [Caudoviricetes sp.]